MQNAAAEKIAEELSFAYGARKKLRDEFQSLPDFPTRAAWLSNLVDLSQKPFGNRALEIRSRRRRKYTALYNFQTAAGKKIQVCQKFFMLTLDIGNTSLNNLNNHNYTQSTSGAQLTTHTDSRGKHDPKHKAADSSIQIMLEHFLSFPREESHYTLAQKQTLNPDLSVKKMHELYKDQEEGEGRRVLSYARYLQEFNKTGLKFGRYAVDECALCTELKEKMEALNPSSNPEELAEFQELEETKKEHLTQADIAYKQQKYDYELSQTSGSGVEAVWFDMAAVFQLPRLATGKAFYLRKYKTYMEGFHKGSTKENHMYLWGMLDGKKGSTEVVSALYLFLIQHVASTTKHLILWMDNAASQNKNRNLLLYMLLLTDPKSPLFRFDRVYVKFAPVGHTYNYCDRSFALRKGDTFH